LKFLRLDVVALFGTPNVEWVAFGGASGLIAAEEAHAARSFAD